MTITNITGQNFCPIEEAVPPYIPEWYGMNCNERLLVAYHNINSCPEAKKLFDTVLDMGKIFLSCVPSYLAPFGAQFNWGTRTVSFSEDKIDKSPGTSLFLFELNNAEKA